MTQAVSNTLNNLEQQLLSMDKKSNKVENVNLDKKDLIGMDKTPDFKKVLDSKTVVKKSSIAGVKSSLNNSESKTLSDFKAILKEFTEDANVETSLDLTLAKDIGEIISQLQEAIKDTTEAIEENSEEAKSDSDIGVDSLISQDENESDETLGINFSSNQDVADLGAEDANDTAQKVPFEQVLTFVDKTSMFDKNDYQDLKQNVEDNDGVLSETFENIQSEIIEFSENITTETTAKNSSDYLELDLDAEALKELNIESISAEANTSEGETFMQNQTAQEHSVKVMINQDVEAFEVKIEPTFNQQNDYASQVKPTEVTPSRLLDQISKHIENLQSGSKVNLVLNPESLGKVNIQLLTTKEGLTAQFTVTTQEARDLLMKGLDGLKETLASHGVGVDNVSVKVADSQKSEYSQDWTEQESSGGGNKDRKNPDREEKEKGLFEKMMAQTTEQDENGKV